MYVILDMHGCPGGQSTDHCSGSARKCELFTNSTYIAAMKKLWLAISTRYKNNPTVAAYDIMNEAEPYYGGVESDPRNRIYDIIIKAIRANGDRHIIAVEGIWSLSMLPLPENSGWDNVVYELHSYGDDIDSYCSTVYSCKMWNKSSNRQFYGKQPYRKRGKKL